jgi:hypothetical protein
MGGGGGDGDSGGGRGDDDGEREFLSAGKAQNIKKER